MPKKASSPPCSTLTPTSTPPASSVHQRAKLVQHALETLYPQPATHLTAHTPWQLLVAVILSARSKDAIVNTVTPALFATWPEPTHLAHANISHVEKVIHSTGFYRDKAKHIIGAAQGLLTHFHGKVPQTLHELTSLPGVGRKTANVVLWGAFGINEGIAVDTHVKRTSYRLALTQKLKPDDVEQDLMVLFPRKEWGNVNHRLVWFGRDICTPRKALCHTCIMATFCPKIPWQSPK